MKGINLISKDQMDLLKCEIIQEKMKRKQKPLQELANCDPKIQDKTEIPEIVARAIRSASRHNIQLMQGRRNPGLGNCSIESTIYNIEDRREFTSDQKVKLHPKEARQVWLTELQTAIESNYPDVIPTNIPNFNVNKLWDKLKEDNVYEIDLLGDLMMNAISRGSKKRILIFNTSPDAADPIYVLQPETFGVDRETDIPIILAYNQSHYESLHPRSLEDVQKTQQLVKEYLEGSYPYSKKDIDELIKPYQNEATKCVTEIKYDADWPKYTTVKMSSPKVLISKKRKKIVREIKDNEDWPKDSAVMISSEKLPVSYDLPLNNRFENLVEEKITKSSSQKNERKKTKKQNKKKNNSSIVTSELTIPLLPEVETFYEANPSLRGTCTRLEKELQASLVNMKERQDISEQTLTKKLNGGKKVRKQILTVI